MVLLTIGDVDAERAYLFVFSGCRTFIAGFRERFFQPLNGYMMNWCKH